MHQLPWPLRVRLQPPCSPVPVNKASRVHSLERLRPSPTYILSWVSNFTLISLEARVAFCALQETKCMVQWDLGCREGREDRCGLAGVSLSQ